MVTACIACEGGRRVVALEKLQGSTLAAEILECCGVLEGTKLVARCDARLLTGEAGVTTEDMLHFCVGKDGGMPSWAAAADPDVERIFATCGTEEAGPGPEQGLAEGIGRLLHRFSEDVSEIEGAVLNLNLLLTSGQHSSCM